MAPGRGLGDGLPAGWLRDNGPATDFWLESSGTGRAVEEAEKVIDRIAAAQREELEQEIVELRDEAERVAEEARELAGEVPF